MKNVIIHVDGVPKAQPRPRFTARGHAYDPKTAEAWKCRITSEYRRAGVYFEGPVFLTATFTMPLAKRKGKSEEGRYHCIRPDLDNLLKAVMDALTMAGAWRDDAQVSEVSVRKVYAGEGQRAGAVIQLVDYELEAAGARL
jgi:Holliday junction resolvase RusA-like endonuclease